MPELAKALAAVRSFCGPDSAAWPEVFRRLAGVAEARQSTAGAVDPRAFGISKKALAALLACADPIRETFGVGFEEADQHPETGKARRGVGQLLLGQLAEKAFEDIYKRALGTEDLVLEDSRGSRNDTDYRVLNGSKRAIFRANIKFHGTLFKKAEEMVGLPSEDCFALATYKIWQGLQKEKDEHLPYIFVVVSLPGVTGQQVGELVPTDLARIATLVRVGRKIPKKRDIEERIVEHVRATEMERGLAGVYESIRSVPWRVISATKADRLLRDRLFERVYAVRVRAFAQNYRNAELDMHFSLDSDLTPLEEFLRVYREEGVQGVTARFSRGVF